MNICFINTTLYGTDGISRVLSCLTSELSKRHNVTVITFENEKNVDKNKYDISPAVNVVFWEPIYGKCKIRRAAHKLNQKTEIIKKINNKTVYDWIYLPKHMQKKWIDFINKRSFDVVIGVQGKGAYILGSIKDSINCKTIGWQHNSYEAYLENRGLYYWNQDFLFETYIKQLDHYIVLNEHDEEQFRIKKGINTTTIYNPRSFLSEEKSKCEEKRFICVGGLRSAKGFDYAIEAFKMFTKANPGWKLDIFGEGKDKEKLQKMIELNKLSGLVYLRGVTKDIKKEMLNSSVLLLPSRWEGMPMVVLEALEIGLPVVSFDITAINPLVTDNVEGIIVKQFDVTAFAQAMERLAADEELRKQYGKNATTKAKQFAVEEIAKKWEALFQD